MLRGVFVARNKHNELTAFMSELQLLRLVLFSCGHLIQQTPIDKCCSLFYEKSPQFVHIVCIRITIVYDTREL